MIYSGVAFQEVALCGEEVLSVMLSAAESQAYGGTRCFAVLSMTKEKLGMTKGSLSKAIEKLLAEAAERVLVCELVAFGELLQGPAIAIGITKVHERSPVLHVDFTYSSAAFEQFLANDSRVLNNHL